MTFSAKATGGEYKHTLTINEMPKHKHGLSISLATDAGNAGGSSVQGSAYSPPKSNFDWCNYGGGSIAHNNIQPYIVAYMWKRTA